MDRRPRHRPREALRWTSLSLFASSQHGVVARPQLIAAGVPGSQIDSWLRGGRLIAVHRGVYLVASPVEPSLARHSAALLSCGPRSAIGFGDAARLHRLPLGDRSRRIPGARVHVVVAGPHRAPRSGVAIHNSRTLRRGDVSEVEGLRVTSAGRTICDLAPLASERELERMIAEAVYRGELDETGFAERVRAMSFPGAPKLRGIIEDPGGARLTRSEGESILLAAIEAAGLPKPLTQYVVRGCEFDLAWPSERVVVELDGFAHSRTRTKVRDDRKSFALVEAGWPPPLRVNGTTLRLDPGRVTAGIAAALRNATSR